MATLIVSSPFLFASKWKNSPLVVTSSVPSLTETAKAELLIARWASMCGNHGAYLQEDRDTTTLNQCILEGTAPPPDLVRKVCPKVFERIETQGELTVELVRAYFARHGNPTPAVLGMTGTMVRPSGFCWWFHPHDQNIRPFRVSNLFFRLTQEQEVWVHAMDETMKSGFVADNLAD